MQILVISGCIFLQRRTMNIADGTFLRNFMDFGQFTVDSSEVNIENNQKRLMFILVLHPTFGV